MFEYLRIRESFATMFFIIWGMMAKLKSFVTILMVVLFAFTSLDFIAFGSERGRSQTLLLSLISRFQGSIGDVDFESAAALDHSAGTAALIFFIFIAVLLLLNLLIAVMSEAYVLCVYVGTTVLHVACINVAKCSNLILLVLQVNERHF